MARWPEKRIARKGARWRRPRHRKRCREGASVDSDTWTVQATPAKHRQIVEGQKLKEAVMSPRPRGYCSGK